MQLDSYIKFNDPGHGWLAVPLSDLREVGVADKITSYSYISNDRKTVYLEEDLDAWTFLDACKSKFGAVPDRVPQHTNSDSFIRSLRCYDRLKYAA